jgi:RimJ/RimL family protein N-acetyltransferase
MTASPTYLQHLPATLTLRNGRAVTVREIRASDKQALNDAFHRLSADSRYTRFMSSMRSLSDKALEAATHPAPEREFALVAVSGAGEGEAIVGGARYASAAGDDCCEFAITIADDWQGQGMAGPLLSTLMRAAGARGFKSMEGYVLSSNTAMRKLATRLGFIDRPDPEDPTQRLVSAELHRVNEARDA